MIQGMHIEDVGEWSLVSCLSSTRTYFNKLLFQIQVSPILTYRTIYGWCDSISLPNNANDYCESEYSIVLFKENREVGRVNYRRASTTDYGGLEWPEKDSRPTFADGEGRETLVFERRNDATAPTLRRARFTVAPLRVISDCDSIGLFVKSVLSSFSNLDFQTGLRVISRRATI